jgi:UPF0755 protein
MFGRKKRLQLEPPAESQAPDMQPRFAPRSPSEAIKPMPLPPPPPPRLRRRRGGLLSALSGFLTLVIALAIGAGVGIGLLEREAGAPGPLQADKAVVVPRGGTSEIAALLKREGVIEQPFLFELHALLNGQRGKLKAGEYLFKAGVSVDDAVDTLVEGKAITHSITIPEGLTSEQIVQRLRENEILTGEVAEIPPEGTLLPDTHRIERGMTRQQVINLMQNAQRQALNQIWQRRSADLPFKSPEELVILASIVEKETGRADERTRVAGVFLNRLGRRMRLQSDPTIVYGLVGGKGTLGRGILKSEIEKPTPYNTYTIEGLPPGPIANPGRAAMEAVANPSRTKDLYFVADGTGGHAFAETYDQHLRNVARWRQIEKDRAAGNAGGVDRAEPEVRGDTGAAGAVPASVTGEVIPGLGVPTAQPVRPARPPAPAPGGRRAGDATEGTAKDPLLNRTYDLTSPKTVPALRQP